MMPPLAPRIHWVSPERSALWAHVAEFSASPVALVIGFIQQRLVEAWAELHEEELLTDWQLLEQGRKPSPITPLQ